MAASLRGNYFRSLVAHPTWALIAAFGTYFCMYGFRKPYTAATYTSVAYWGLNFKFILVLAQTLGYLTAKWAGIKVVSEVKPYQRIGLLLFLIVFAECMLVLFGLLPSPWNVLCLFLNGLPLGVVFGLILSFLEGRRNSEALIAGLCASFIISDGFSKSVGSELLLRHVSEQWMPCVAGALFMVPMLLFAGMLSQVPLPSADDEAHRSARRPMDGRGRRDFFMKYAAGLTGITIAYLFVTFLRSFRADFAPELWHDLGFSQTPSLYTLSEVMVSLGVILISGLTIYIRNHMRAFEFSMLTGFGGFLICILAVMALYAGLDSFVFMVLIGLGVYIPYVGIHTTVFERLIAITREKANVGFLMYVVDSVGYTGYALLLLFRHLYPSTDLTLTIFLNLCLVLGLTGCVVMLLSYGYFKINLKRHEPTTQLSLR